MLSDKKAPDADLPVNVKFLDAFRELVSIVRRLRGPDGCPWDREQTAESLKPYAVEETYEVLDAIDSRDPAALCEELGDLLLQVMLHAQIASEQNHFNIGDVIEGISAKLITRHPHVFGNVAVSGSNEVIANWEAIKKSEKKDRGLFDGLPKQLPALQRAERIGQKAARVGFDWPDRRDVREKVTEELAELDEAVENGSADEIEHELGDLLFAIAQWARHLEQHPEGALASGCIRFISRFSKMERAAADQKRQLTDLSLDELEALWQRAKRI